MDDAAPQKKHKRSNHLVIMALVVVMILATVALAVAFFTVFGPATLFETSK